MGRLIVRAYRACCPRASGSPLRNAFKLLKDCQFQRYQMFTSAGTAITPKDGSEKTVQPPLPARHRTPPSRPSPTETSAVTHLVSTTTNGMSLPPHSILAAVSMHLRQVSVHWRISCVRQSPAGPFPEAGRARSVPRRRPVRVQCAENPSSDVASAYRCGPCPVRIYQRFRYLTNVARVLPPVSISGNNCRRLWALPSPNHNVPHMLAGHPAWPESSEAALLPRPKGGASVCASSTAGRRPDAAGVTSSTATPAAQSPTSQAFAAAAG